MAIPYTFTNGTVANATEVNANFTYVMPYFATKTNFTIFLGSRATTDIGSILIPANTLGNSGLAYLDMDFKWYTTTPAGNPALTFAISGPGANTEYGFGTAENSTGYFNVKTLLGNEANYFDIRDVNGALVHQTFSPISLGSDIVIKFKFATEESTASGGIVNLIVTGFKQV